LAASGVDPKTLTKGFGQKEEEKKEDDENDDVKRTPMER